ncbi:MAG: hypothetical protein UDB11_10620 [Peptococcaceae bacterium]|nr:hypothetical protein [Peptococcaceae bacterium]
MGDLFYCLLSNRQITFVNMVIGVLLFIALLFLFFCKSSRDERGRKIIGKASIVALICFGICATLFSHYMQYIAVQQSSGGELVLDAILAVNAIQLIFNITVIVESAGILILKHRE